MVRDDSKDFIRVTKEKTDPNIVQFLFFSALFLTR